MAKKSEDFPLYVEHALLLKFNKDMKIIGFECVEYKNWYDVEIITDYCKDIININDSNIVWLSYTLDDGKFNIYITVDYYYFGKHNSFNIKDINLFIIKINNIVIKSINKRYKDKLKYYD